MVLQGMGQKEEKNMNDKNIEAIVNQISAKTGKERGHSETLAFLKQMLDSNDLHSLDELRNVMTWEMLTSTPQTLDNINYDMGWDDDPIGHLAGLLTDMVEEAVEALGGWDEINKAEAEE